jgi:hypothetical protein
MTAPFISFCYFQTGDEVAGRPVTARKKSADGSCDPAAGQKCVVGPTRSANLHRERVERSAGRPDSRQMVENNSLIAIATRVGALAPR